nr:universal stress protein [Saccharopolyspora sp. ASAGF58]
MGFGSVARGVLHHSDCPVVIVGETQHDEGRRADE